MNRNILILLLLLLMSSIFAFDIEIGDGTSSDAVPVNGLYDFSWSNFIINSNQIGMSAEFNQIKFQRHCST